MARVHREFVGERRERREDARAAHDHAVLRLTDLVQRDVVARLRHVALRLVDRRLHDRMRQRDVAAAQEFLISHEVFRARLVAVRGPLVGAPGKAGVRHVHVVRRAPHHADRVLGGPRETLVAARNVLARARDHVTDVDPLAGLGVRHQTVVGVFVLQIERGGQTLRGTRERRMISDVGDLVAAHPDRAVVFQSREEFGARTSRHEQSPAIRYESVCVETDCIHADGS